MTNPLFLHRTQDAVDDTRVVMRAAIPRERDGVTFAKQAFFLLPVELSERVKGSVHGAPGPAMVALIDWALSQLEAEGKTLVVEERR
ncbi:MULTISPECIES: hypothetical protein [Stenotrophomonas]|uniref:Uncharacterized protein n=1 Tax=Neophaeococcomyces mojaviensis TaxID=3383035 RepID=A0ACC2ZS27_9EURO|nr:MULTISPECIES: hypothetical protein [Stenotrophomonas]KAJ9650395.1 hypothetical protein H2198_010305 [Knufia sp. JES_112]MBA0288064.1 hypothetical protein [Stenotrophomonas maltophilia]MBA0326413.1 hypothetical protein [Stenotrophomonas maltophilia]MBA0355530.1 hypothetical protein [Stenotrophomonas maltophilia]MBH1531787.1 hypothetical protein [Stenotrophomonas maltophilia]